GGICDLQEQPFGGLLERRSFEGDGSIDTSMRFDSPVTDPVGVDRQLLNRVPASPLEDAGLRLTGQLNLRRYHLDSCGARINHGERHKQARAVLEHLAD